VAAFFIETPLAANHPRAASHHHRGHHQGIVAIEQLLIVGGRARLDAILGQHLIQMRLRNISKRWTMPIRDWSGAMNQFAILSGGRVPLGGLGNSFTQNPT
jgi:hypothetical protein